MRLEIEADADREIDRAPSQANFELEDWQVFRVNGPVNLSRLFHLYEETTAPDLKFKPFISRELQLTQVDRTSSKNSRHRDVLLHHPYDSYNTVVDFIEQAAEDPTFCHQADALPHQRGLAHRRRARSKPPQHKEVTAVVELKARFDEATNIRWARSLEEAGVQVFHGLVGLKTHCKLALIVRRDDDGDSAVTCHLGTGNYNPITARFTPTSACSPPIRESPQRCTTSSTSSPPTPRTRSYDPLLLRRSIWPNAVIEPDSTAKPITREQAVPRASSPK